MIYPTPDYLRRCIKGAQPLLEEKSTPGNVNLSSIATCLIQNVGRFAEHYASDFLITWKHVEALCQKHDIAPEEDSVIFFGIRKSGVDHTAYLISRLKNWYGPYNPYPNPDGTYRKCFAVHITAESGYLPEISVKLYDITERLARIEESDIEWNANDAIAEYEKKYPGQFVLA